MVRSNLGLALLAVPASATCVAREGTFDCSGYLADYTWEQYQQDFDKAYNSITELSSRKGIFARNLEMVKAHNAQPEKTWWATVNEFTDLTNDEFRAIRTGHSPDTRNLNRVSLSAKLSDLPDSVDWRKEDPRPGQTTSGVVTPVKNQASCGSCWAFSATQTLESHLAIATGEEAPVLSPQQIVSCAPNPDHCGGTGGCQGSTQPLAFNYTQTAGITLNSDYPYTSGIGITGQCKEAKIKPVAQNDGYEVLPENDYTALVTALATKGPIAISVAAGGLGWQLYGGGVYSDSGAIHPFLCDFTIDHAVQLVGYGEDNGKMYWTVRNSWGGGWGEGGYIRVERHGEGNEPCGMDKKPQDGMACAGDTDPKKYCGLCGILSSSSYPTGMKLVSEITV